MYTFSATIAIKDDDGFVYERVSVENIAKNLERTGATVFTIATGEGIDTDTGDREPVIIVQGFTNDLNATREQLDYYAFIMKQRAIGWFVSTDSYSEVK